MKAGRRSSWSTMAAFIALFSKEPIAKHSLQVHLQDVCHEFPLERILHLVRPGTNPQLTREFAANQTVYGVPVFMAIAADEYCTVDPAVMAHLEGKSRCVGHQCMSSECGEGRCLPLGPRFDLQPRYGNVPEVARLHLWNFVGSRNTERTPGPITHGTRSALKTAAMAWTPNGTDAVLKMEKAWVPAPSAATRHMSPQDFQQVLLQSYYTLCPVGHNLEMFRFWEAVDAGSVPIVVLQGPVETGSGPLDSTVCRDPSRDVLRAKPPVVVMED